MNFIIYSTKGRSPIDLMNDVKYKEKKVASIISAVYVDDLTQLGAGISANAVMTQFGFCTWAAPALSRTVNPLRPSDAYMRQ